MENVTKHCLKPIFIYLFFTFLFTGIVDRLSIYAPATGKIGIRIYGYAGMWCPAIGTLVTSKLLGWSMSSLGWKWGVARYRWGSYLVPLLYTAIAYLIIWGFGWGGFYNYSFLHQAALELGWQRMPSWLFIVSYFAVQAVFGMVSSMATALGEEIGWRGFLVPILGQNMSYTGVSIISGVIWAVWHYPVLIWGEYNNGTPTLYALSCFTVMVISMSFILTWFRLKSGNLWTGVILHASHNLFIQSFFTPMTKDTGHTAWFIDEFGCVLPFVTFLFAFFFWTKREKFPLTCKYAPITNQNV